MVATTPPASPGPRADPPLHLADLEARALDRLDPMAWAYFSGGAADERTLAANLRDWGHLKLWPRVLVPLEGLSLATRLGGRALRHPILLAPVAHQALAHPDGERATALAAAAQGAGMVLSLQSSVPVEAVAQILADEPGAGPLWFQVAALGDRGWWRSILARAEAAGCEALVVTVDAPLHGVRDRERAAGFRLPPGIRAVHLADAPQHTDLATLLSQALTWSDLAWLRSQTRLPLWLKGVLHPADARQAVTEGVDGLIVSNHGGRTLDSTVSTAWALPRVVAAVEGRVPVLVDGGLRRGTDVLKALALGASAVLVGRPQVHALAAQGALGVAQMLRLLQDELIAAMALSGARRVTDLTPDLLVD